MIPQRFKYIWRNLFHRGAGLIVALLIIGLIGLLWLELTWYTYPAATESTYVNVALIIATILIVGGMVGNAIIALRPGHGAKPSITESLEHLVKVGRTLATRDCAALSTALTELAQGNLTTSLTIQSQPVSLSSSPEVERLAEVFNAIIVKIQESANEFNVVTDEPCNRLCYVGADSYLEGRACGEAMGQALDGKGQVAIITGSFISTAHQLRCKGFQSILREKYPGVQVVEVVESHEKLEITCANTQALLERYLDLGGIYISEGATPFGTARAVAEGGKGGQIKIVCHDLVDETMHYVQQGVITATLSQDPFAQGYDPVIHLYNYLAADRHPPSPRLLTRMEVITGDNYDRFWQPDQGVIESEVATERLAQPVANRNARPLRIAVLGREDSAFWDPVHEGVLAAADKLGSYNTTVEWIVPDQTRREGDISAATLGPAIEDLVAQGYNALATGVFDRNLVPYINRAVAAGIPVATFNSEPSSLRGLIVSLTERTQKLIELSQDLANATQSSERSTAQIADAIQQMVNGLKDETISVGEATASTQEITHTIESFAQGTYEQDQAAESVLTATDQISQATEMAIENTQAVADATARAMDVAQQGAEAVMQTLQQMKSIQDSVSSSAARIEEMATHSERIGNITVTMDDIAAQTKLLALNASIEAAQAGESGLGFAEVAKEVRNLATKSASATKEIAALIRTTQNNITEAVASIKVAVNKVQEGSELATRSGQALEELLASATTMNQQADILVGANTEVSGVIANLLEAVASVSAVIEKNRAATEQLGVNAKHTLDLVKNVRVISEKNAASTTEISAATKQVTGRAKEVGQAATVLATMAEEIQGAIAQFKSDDG